MEHILCLGNLDNRFRANTEARIGLGPSVTLRPVRTIVTHNVA